MTEFNIIQDVLDKAQTLEIKGMIIKLLGFRGNINGTMQPRENHVADNNTRADVYIYQQPKYSKESFEWKQVKYSKKGYFINTQVGRIYLNQFNI